MLPREFFLQKYNCLFFFFQLFLKVLFFSYQPILKFFFFFFYLPLITFISLLLVQLFLKIMNLVVGCGCSMCGNVKIDVVGGFGHKNLGH